jgi:hypothetical protein
MKNTEKYLYKGIRQRKRYARKTEITLLDNNADDVRVEKDGKLTIQRMLNYT